MLTFFVFLDESGEDGQMPATQSQTRQQARQLAEALKVTENANASNLQSTAASSGSVSGGLQLMQSLQQRQSIVSPGLAVIQAKHPSNRMVGASSYQNPNKQNGGATTTSSARIHLAGNLQAFPSGSSSGHAVADGEMLNNNLGGGNCSTTYSG